MDRGIASAQERGRLDDALATLSSVRKTFAGARMKMEEAIAAAGYRHDLPGPRRVPGGRKDINESIRLHGESNDYYGESDARSRLADVYRAQGSYAASEASARQAILLARKAGAPETEAEAE